MNAIAASIAVVGSAIAAAYGNSKVISKALESMARQPEIINELRGTMIIGAALIEAVPILGVIVALLLVFGG